MQGNHDDVNGDIEWRERRCDEIADEYRQLRAEIDEIRHAQSAVAGMSPEERRALMLRRTREIGKRALALTGIALLWDWFRSTTPREAVAATALTAVAAVGTVGVLPESPEWGIAPDVPPVAVGTPTPGVSVRPDVPGSGKTPGESPPMFAPPSGSGELGVGPQLAPPPMGGPAPTNGPTGTVAPLPPSPSGTPGPSPTPPPSPSPTITTTPTPTASPTPTITATPTSSPTPTPTVTPTAPPDIPEECLLFVDIPELLELCLLDLEQGGSGLLDGAIGGRTLYG